MDTQTLRTTYSQTIRLYIASRVTGSAVDDILQQVFLKAHEHSFSLKDTAAAKARLYRIAQTTIIDRYRQEYGGKNGEMSDEFRDHLEDDTSSSNDQKLAKNISSCLLPMIDDLDTVSQEVMRRYLDNNTTYRHIAEEVWLSESNIKVLIHRAKKKLQEKYKQCCTLYRDEQGTLIDTRCENDCGCDNTVLK